MTMFLSSLRESAPWHARTLRTLCILCTQRTLRTLCTLRTLLTLSTLCTLLALCTLGGVAACGPRSSSGPDDDATTHLDAAVPSGDGAALTDGGHTVQDGSVHHTDGSAVDAAPPRPDAAVPSVSMCLPACTTVSDCDMGSAPYDSDNYTCTGGACLYTGCVSDGECQTLGAYLCRQPTGYAMPLCLLACVTANDCDMGSAPYDPDNYACTGGVCLYTGCVSDSECQTLGAYVCRTTWQTTIPTCLPACATVSDCNLGSAPYDSDNYVCTDGACHYTGCVNTPECQSLGSYICHP